MSPAPSPRLIGSYLLQTAIDDLDECALWNWRIKQDADRTFRYSIIEQLVFQRLYHLAAVRVNTNMIFVRVKPKEWFALVFECRHAVADSFFRVWHSLFGEGANPLKLYPF